MARRRPSVAHSKARFLPGLQLHEAAGRVQVLLRERARLAREVQKKQQQLGQLQQRLSREAEQVASQMFPLVDRHGSLVSELSSLFGELLSAGRLAKRTRAYVAHLRRSLEVQGVLTPLEAWPEDDLADDERGGHEHDEPPFRNERGPGQHRAAPAGEVAGARQVGQEKRSLRDTFRNLARAIHPDKAQHEADRAQRTEVMKQVTRAYEDGDLARLVQLESEWQSQLADAGSADPEARCRELERINRELLDQVRSLTRQLRDTKRQAQEAFAGGSPDEVIAAASQELDQLQALCELVRDFRDGRLTFAELKRRTSPSEGELELLEAMMFEELMAESTRSRGRSRGR